VERYDGDIIGIGVLVDRSEKDLGLGRPIFSCLLCQFKHPDFPGSWLKYVARS